MKSINKKTSRISEPFLLVLVIVSTLFGSCKKSDSSANNNVSKSPQYTIEQAISDEAQRNTISFDGLAFLTGCLGAQSFLPPGKVADYSGFQYLRDNDPTNMGHNTSFVTIIAFNVLHILTTDQINMYVERAENQINQIDTFGYNRYPLMKAFRRLQQGDLPSGNTGLSQEAVMNFGAGLYTLDGEIAYDRAKLFGRVISSLSATQRQQLDALKALNGIAHWDSTLSNPLAGLNLSPDVDVAVMTYASEMYAWYAGDVTSDTYFCPERHGSYFGSFYLKDWPAMGNPNYTISETLTADAGQNFLKALTPTQDSLITGIVDEQRSALMQIVTTRQSIATELRKFLGTTLPDSATVISLSKQYGELDGELSYYYATAFTQVFQTLSTNQVNQLNTLANQLGYLAPTGGFLYSQPISMPNIINTDFMFK